MAALMWGPGLGPAWAAGEVVLVKSTNVTAFEAVAEEFADHCRVRARVVKLDDRTDLGALRAGLQADDVVVAIGDRALAAVAGGPARVVSLLALGAVAPSETPGQVVVVDPPPSFSVVMRALRELRPRGRRLRVGVIFGAATAALVAQARLDVAADAAANDMTTDVDRTRDSLQGAVDLIEIRASDGPEAVRALERAALTLDVLWLTPDPHILTTQLFQYALALEIKYGLPVIAATRQQVLSGALIAYDTDTDVSGQQAAEIVHQLLAGADAAELAAKQHPVGRIVVNGAVARRLGLDLHTLTRVGARIE